MSVSEKQVSIVWEGGQYTYAVNIDDSVTIPEREYVGDSKDFPLFLFNGVTYVKAIFSQELSGSFHRTEGVRVVRRVGGPNK